MTETEIPEEAVQAAAEAWTPFWSQRPEPQAAILKQARAALTAALPHLRVQETHGPIGVLATDAGPFIRCSCGSNPTPRYWLEEHWAGDVEVGKRLVLQFFPNAGDALHHRPVVDREAVERAIRDRLVRSNFNDNLHEPLRTQTIDQWADVLAGAVLALLPIEEGEGSEVYFCPASGEMEIHPGGGFDTCCDRPQDHQTDIKWLTKLCHRLGKAEGRKEALTEIADEMAVEQDDLGYVTIQTDHDTWRILVDAKTSSQVTGAASSARTDSDGYTDLPKDAKARRTGLPGDGE